MNRDYTRTLLAGMADRLRKVGFSRRGQLFQRPVADVVHLVQLQKSQSSSANTVRATINLAVWVPTLAAARAGARAIASAPGAHWRVRLGFTMPERRDTWWEVHGDAQAEASAAEIAAALVTYGLPRLDEIGSSEDLERAWRAGHAPGLTEQQRLRYLDQLVRLRSRGGAGPPPRR